MIPGTLQAVLEKQTYWLGKGKKGNRTRLSEMDTETVIIPHTTSRPETRRASAQAMIKRDDTPPRHRKVREATKDPLGD